MNDPVEELVWMVRREWWMDGSACKGLDPAMFHMEQGQSAAKARAVCDTCGVRQECLEYGQSTGSVGVWGGEVLTLKNAKKKKVREVVPVVLIHAKDDSKPVRITGVKRRHGHTARQEAPGQIAASKAR